MKLSNPFSAANKRARANSANEKGMALADEGKLEAAIREYQRAMSIDPKWAVPFYNLGLLYKYENAWRESLENNLRATELDASDQASWWNLGIAATALGRWDVARHAWRGAGLKKVPGGQGPVDLPCGRSPIRLNPDDDAEVVWSDRLDPARARLLSIPLADYCFGDVVLNDGAAVGYRMLDERKVPVFNCLALLEPSALSTWCVEIEPGKSRDLDALAKLADEHDLAAEDWSTSLHMLCKACSEGEPHEQHDHEREGEVEGPHRVAIAAPDEAEVVALLEHWRAGARDVEIGDIELSFAHD